MVRERAKVAKTIVSRSLVSYINPSNPISEQFRTIRNNIQFAADGQTIRSLIITSPAEGDGKSTAAINLAVSMAQRGEKVLLMDVNLRNPMLHKIFNSQTSPGLSNVLANQLSLVEAIQLTDVAGLELLTSGLKQQNTTDLLDSKVMKELIELAESRYDRVVLDCPPVLTAPDTNVLANKCDGVVLVLSSGKSTHVEALEAKQALSFAGANIIGALLNKKTR